MTAVRTVYRDMPKTLTIPLELQHRAVEVIMIPLEDEKSGDDFKSWLCGMPQEVDEKVFERSNDTNEGRLWAI
ncbi:MAG TPA: hypothetical protein CFH83_03350 [Sulfuricurvum kujiense]|uniref:Uncharacterized protein n=1 Tax=Sulfuricurvum kujiense TaxID=148813 RepID=A0A2D3WIU0_9BACT|nr:hypothetical protein [Sulfuricurvum kujiense]DAB38950.1 MAG TPA: hypothetical protein CFH83_03350 [Sulfuricurvum kujiense]